MFHLLQTEEKRMFPMKSKCLVTSPKPLQQDPPVAKVVSYTTNKFSPLQTRPCSVRNGLVDVSVCQKPHGSSGWLGAL